jgi:hypothetical protein
MEVARAKRAEDASDTVPQTISEYLTDRISLLCGE